MAIRIIFAAMSLSLGCNQALACSPAPADLPPTAREVTALAKARVARSDAIIDALVVRLSDGRIMLRPIRVWKGQKQASYEVINGTCDISLRHKSNIRVLLEKEGRYWFIMPPILDRNFNVEAFDKAIDAAVGKARPRNYVSVVDSMPLPPP